MSKCYKFTLLLKNYFCYKTNVASNFYTRHLSFVNESLHNPIIGVKIKICLKILQFFNQLKLLYYTFWNLHSIDFYMFYVWISGHLVIKNDWIVISNSWMETNSPYYCSFFFLTGKDFRQKCFGIFKFENRRFYMI